ncbi:MAG: hypothetical protein J6Y31_04785 [Bacteroidales bacterium]|nr:hypothetical protein [Bacteroidales bacterium]
MRKLIIILTLIVPLATLSCKRNEPARERDEYIRVYASRDSEIALDSTWVSVRGETKTLYVRSNVPFTAKWQNEGPAWGHIDAPKKVSDGLWSISLTADPISKRVYSASSAEGLYNYRYGVLMLVSPGLSLGKYFVVEQGYVSRIACDFSWLYGGEDPNAAYNDVQMVNWTAAQKNMGFTSHPLPGQENAYVYGKSGYLRLGNEKGFGADLVTPHTAFPLEDTLLVVSFKAVVQRGDNLPDFNGGTEPILPMKHTRKAVDDETDLSTLTVEVSGGGYIREKVNEKGTSMTLNLSTYDRESPDFPSDMFSDGRYLIFVEGTKNNPISVNTSFRFVTDNMGGQPGSKCSRVFLDDIFVYAIDKRRSEDPYLLYGLRSGKDTLIQEQ